MRHGVVGVDDVVVAVFFYASFVRISFGIGRSESDVPAVRRKVERFNTGFDVGDLAGFAAGGRDEINLRGVFLGVGQRGFARGEKGEPAAVGRPGGIGAGLCSFGQRESFAGGDIREPDLLDEGVLVPVSVRDLVGDEFAVGR